MVPRSEAWGKSSLVLLLDEIDKILEKLWVTELFNQLRALIYSVLHREIM